MKTLRRVTDHPVQLYSHWGGWAALILIVASTLAVSIQRCLTKPFWADEIITIFVTNLSGSAARREALFAGVDGMPPAFYEVTKLFLHLPFPEHIAWRLPALIGFGLALTCVFLFVRRNNGDSAGLLAAALLAMTQAAWYSAEARPYGLLLGPTALAAVCWQRAEDTTLWAVVLGLSLGSAVSLHYLAPVVVACFALAEIALALCRKRIRWSIWAAFCASAVPALLDLPTALKVRENFSEYFWAKPSLWAVQHAYADSLTVLPIQVTIVVPFLMLLLIASAWQLARSGEPRASLLSDILLPAALLCFPVLAALLALMTHGGFAPRYGLPVTVGAAMAIPIAINWRTSSVPRLLTVTVVLGLLAQNVLDFKELRAAKTAAQAGGSTSALEALRAVREFSDLPLVVSNAHRYLQAFQYGPPELRDRMLYLNGREQSIQLTGSDSVAKLMGALPPFAPVNVSELDTYIRENTTLLVFTDGATVGLLNWLPTYLKSRGWNFEQVAAVAGGEVVLARAPVTKQE